MKNSFGLFFIFFSSIIFVYGQNENYKVQTDSLEKLINGFDKAGLFDSSVYYSKAAIALAEKENNAGDIVYFSNLCGTAFMNSEKYFESLEKYSDASKIAHANGWFITESSLLNNIGAIYFFLGDNISALEYFMKALKIKEERNETKKLAGALINIGGLYNILGDHNEGLVFLEKAYKNALEQDDLYMQAKALISMGDVYFSLNQYGTARENFEKALPLSDSVADMQAVANIIVKIGDTYKNSNDTVTALKYYSQSLKLSDSIGYRLGMATAAMETGKIFYDKKNYPKALRYLKMSAGESEKINATPKMLMSYKLLSGIYNSQKDYGKALNYYTLYSKINDSLHKSDTHDKFSTIKALYEVDKKQRELDNLKLQNKVTQLQAKQSRYLLYGAAGLIVLITFTVILVFRQHKIKNLQKTIRLEQKLLRSQINPHFIFNALTAVQRFVFEKSTIVACDYIGNFANLIRAVLNNSAVEKISLEDEILFINNYLTLQALRFDNKFTFNIDAGGDIDTKSILIPPMITQPFAENAIEHGIRHLNKKGHIDIKYLMESNFIKITVEDNGIGREKAKHINAGRIKRHRSMATSITSGRLLYLNNSSDGKINMEYCDIKNNRGEQAGTKVTLKVPFEREF